MSCIYLGTFSRLGSLIGSFSTQLIKLCHSGTIYYNGNEISQLIFKLASSDEILS